MLKDFEVVLSHVLEPRMHNTVRAAGLGPTYLPRLLDHYQEPAGATRQLSFTDEAQNVSTHFSPKAAAICVVFYSGAG